MKRFQNSSSRAREGVEDFRQTATASRWRLRGAAVLAVVALFAVTACSRLTEDNLQKIHNGMTTAEVKAILGEPTSSQSGSALGLVSGTKYVYHTETSDVTISFVDDKVIATEGDFK